MIFVTTCARLCVCVCGATCGSKNTFMNGNYAAAAAAAANFSAATAAAAAEAEAEAAKMTAKTTYAFPLGSRDVFRLHSSTVRVCVCECARCLSHARSTCARVCVCVFV